MVSFFTISAVALNDFNAGPMSKTLCVHAEGYLFSKWGVGVRWGLIWLEIEGGGPIKNHPKRISNYETEVDRTHVLLATWWLHES